MDQDSTNSGERRNWRERLGIAKDNPKDLPKISEEFRAENGGKAGEPRLVVGPAVGGASRGGGGESAAGSPGLRGPVAPPVRPAPMAPRPGSGPAPQRPPQNQHAGNQMPPQMQRPGPAPSRPQQISPQRAPGGPPQPMRGAPLQAVPPPSSGAPAGGPDDFAERLRQQREAAERLAKQRAATARAPVTPTSPQPLARNPEPAPAPPRFSFAPDELAGEGQQPTQQQPPSPAAPKIAPRPAAQGHGQQAGQPGGQGQQGGQPSGGGNQPGWQQPFQAAPSSPSAYPPPRGPGYPYGQQPYQQRMAAPAYARQPQPQAAPAQPATPYAAAAYGQETWTGAETMARPVSAHAAARPPMQPRAEAYPAHAETGYGNAAEDVYADAPAPAARVRRPVPAPMARPQPQPVRPRVAEPDEAEEDEAFEAERRSDRQPVAVTRQRTQAAEYNSAYREYDDEFTEEEPRSRGGPLILLLALLALALIVGVLIFFYTQNFSLPSSHSSATGSGDIPVIAAPEGAAKATPDTPEPQLDTPAATPAATPPQQLQGRKQIYDRILGEEAVEQNRLVPTEEQPVAPPGAAGRNSGNAGNGDAGSGDTGTNGGAPLPEPSSDGAPARDPNGQNGADPEPLPLPPPPGVQGNNTPSTPSGIEAVANHSGSDEPSAGADSFASSSNALIEPTSEQGADEPAGGASAGAPTRVASADESGTRLGKVQGNSAESAASNGQGSVGAVGSSGREPAVAKTKPSRAKEATSAVVPPAESETIVDNSPLPPVHGSAAAQGAATAQQSGGAGPVQLGRAQTPGVYVPPALPPSAAQPTAFDQFQRQAQQSASAGQRPRTGRNDDPLDGLRTPLSGRASGTQQQQQLAMLAPTQANLPEATPPPAQPQAGYVPPPAYVQPPQAQQQLAPVRPAAPAVRATAPPAPRPQQQAALTPATQPAVSGGGTGYVIQLASFRSEAEAAGEFHRLQSRHPQLVGALQQRIQRADLGASGTFYRLGVGPLGSKDQASKLCNSLIAAGEKDCLVRRQ